MTRRLGGRTGAIVLSALGAAAGCGGAPEPQETVEVTLSPYEVASGAELVRCQEMALPSDVDVDVDRITWAFSPGNHHVHVYVSADGATGAAEKTYDCLQAVDFDRWHLLAASQAGGGDWALPEGVAIHVRAWQSLLVQTHYLNVTGEATTARGSVFFRVARPGSVEKRAAAIFGQNRDIAVPPHASGVVEGECALRGTGEILAMTGHYHAHGKRFEAWVKAPEATPDIVYDTAGSAHPVWVAYEGLRFGGHDRLGWSCQFDNDMDAPLEFGPLEDTQEHCNLFAFYTHDSGDAAFVPCLIDAKGP